MMEHPHDSTKKLVYNEEQTTVRADEAGRLRKDERDFLMTWRQTIIMQLGMIEDRLQMPRSIVPKHKR